MKPYIAEAFGTFTLVFAGTGAIVVNDVSGGTVTHVEIAFTFGLVVMAMIYSVGDVSAAHLNPAVTLIVAHISRSVWVAWVKWVGCHAFGAPAEHLHPCGDTPKACPPVREPHAFAVILHGRCCFGRSAKAWHPRSPKDVCNDEGGNPGLFPPVPVPRQPCGCVRCQPAVS